MLKFGSGYVLALVAETDKWSTSTRKHDLSYNRENKPIRFCENIQ